MLERTPPPKARDVSPHNDDPPFKAMRVGEKGMGETPGHAVMTHDELTQAFHNILAMGFRVTIQRTHFGLHVFRFLRWR